MVTFKSYIAKNMIRNCAITIDDINIAHNIYGNPIPIIKGKITNNPIQKTTQQPYHCHYILVNNTTI